MKRPAHLLPDPGDIAGLQLDQRRSIQQPRLMGCGDHLHLVPRQFCKTSANPPDTRKILLSARLVTGFRKGLFVRYGLAGEEVAEFLPRFRELARLRLAEIDQVARTFLGAANAEDVEPVDGGELLRRVNAGEVTVFDVRPFEEYEAGHLPGAISMPLDELREHLLKLPKALPRQSSKFAIPTVWSRCEIHAGCPMRPRRPSSD